MKMNNRRRTSFRGILLKYMVIVSVVPILMLGIFSMFNIYKTLQNNTTKLMDANLTQICNNIAISVDAYEDLEYQIYTNDDVVSWVRQLDEGKDVPATVSRMRRYFNGLLNTKNYIRAITVVTESGFVVTYDTMTAVSTESSWIDNFSKSLDEIYEEVMVDYQKKIYPTEYATTFANHDYYLFHLAHRIVNYKNLDEKTGMVLVSIDEELLQDIYASDSNSDRCTYILDENSRIISNKGNESSIGTTVNQNCASRAMQQKEYLRESVLNGNWLDYYTLNENNFGWTIVTVMNDAPTTRTIFLQTLYALVITLVILFTALLFSLRISRQLNCDIESVARGMGRAMEGDLNTRLYFREDTPEEIQTMANAYNNMIEKLRESNEKERIAIQKQQDAHIVALEAQINPHFLYNTLDTINWMAIDKEEYDISNAINALATILRYAIAKSNAAVTVRDELEWLKKYIFLQQFRLKDTIICELDVDSSLMEAPIHKLLMQPFIENAIIHGFEGLGEEAKLRISMKQEKDYIVIRIIDNGKGMPQEMVEQINRGSIEAKDRTHIGMGNVIMRMKMYYSDQASVHVESTLEVGTVVTLKIPYQEKESL